MLSKKAHTFSLNNSSFFKLLPFIDDKRHEQKHVNRFEQLEQLERLEQRSEQEVGVGVRLGVGVEVGAEWDACNSMLCVEWRVFQKNGQEDEKVASSPFVFKAVGERRDELWKSSCFELFIRPQKAKHYFELNIAPDGSAWNLYKFTGYRQGMSPVNIKNANLKSAVHSSAEATILRLHIDLSCMPELQKALQLEIGASVVWKDSNGQGGDLTYWALHHPHRDRADFHHAESWRIQLTRSANEFQLGIDRLLASPKDLDLLRGKRVGLLAHPASVTSQLEPSVDALVRSGVSLSALFGPQHGIRGDKQDNMVESADFVDHRYGIPAYSLYGEVRRLTPQMLGSFDVLLVDLQDLGTRIYTFLTTLFYILEDISKHNLQAVKLSNVAPKEVWVLDRPNPAGRPVEGLLLRAGWESFVGACEGLPMRHGLTLGEAALWFQKHFALTAALPLRVVPMSGYQPQAAPGYGWPTESLSWVNPSPNAAQLSMARCYPGTVLLEGTWLSEGRGTTRALELMGAPGLDSQRLLAEMHKLEPEWLRGCRLRSCFFEPTFHKHVGQLCEGLQIHVDDNHYNHEQFKPYRLILLALKSLRKIKPEFEIWRDFHYEYERDRLAFDLINGSDLIRNWVNDPKATPRDLDEILTRDEEFWQQSIQEFLLY